LKTALCGKASGAGGAKGQVIQGGKKRTALADFWRRRGGGGVWGS